MLTGTPMDLAKVASVNTTTPEPHFVRMSVSPATASDWLLRNEENRSHREALVRQYASDMDAGRWQFNGEPIQFGISGKLLNGQHRLKAILRSQTTQEFLVGFNLPDNAQLTIDSGARRTAGDALALGGFTHTAAVAAVAKLVVNEVIDGRWITFLNARPTTLQLFETVRANPLIQEAAATAVNTLPTNRMGSPSTMGYAWWRLSQLDLVDCEVFFSKLGTLDNLGATSPILALNKRLTAHKLAHRNGHTVLRQTEVITYVFQAWNAWRRRDERVLIKIGRTDDGRLRAPLPV